VPVLLVCHLVAVSAYAGFQLTVNRVVYPQMSAADGPDFAGYEAGHQRRITPVVGLLFGAVALTTLLLLLDGSLPRAATWSAAVLFGLVLVVTAVGAVPQHAVLSRGFDRTAHRRLMRWDTVRLALACGQVVVGAWLALAID
jgi:heme A synthase